MVSGSTGVFYKGLGRVFDVSDNFGKSVCEALGLEGKRITSLTLKLNAKEVPTVDLTIALPDPVDQSRILDVVSHYELKAKEPGYS